MNAFVRGSFSARVPRSSFARVRRVLVTHIVEEEGEEQKNEKGSRKESHREYQDNHIMRMRMG